MTATVEAKIADRIAAFVVAEAMKLSIEAVVDSSSLTQDGDWITVPVKIIADVDAYENAAMLTNIEYACNDNPPIPGIDLILMPAKSDSRTEKWHEVDELLDRQRHLLDEISVAMPSQSSEDRILRVRKEWKKRSTNLASSWATLPFERN